MTLTTNSDHLMQLNRDTWGTPLEVYKWADSIWQFNADICASPTNYKHPIYFTEKQNSLSFNWRDKLQKYYPNKNDLWVWCNPPYSDPLPWCWQALQSKVGVIMLLKYDVSTEWWRLLDKYNSRFMPITGRRLSHIPPAGIKASSNNFCSLLVEINPYFPSLTDDRWHPVSYGEMK